MVANWVGDGWPVNQALGLEGVIEDGLPFCVELHEQIEIRDVASEHHATILGRCEKNQRIIEHFTLLGLTVSLQPRQESGEDAGFAPCFTVWCKNAMLRPQLDGRGELGDHTRCFRMRRVQQTGEGRQFRFRNRRVPEVPGPESNLRIIRESSLQSVDIDSGVKEQFRERRLEIRQKSQLRAITVGELLLTFLRL
jgi:hypothetical protein